MPSGARKRKAARKKKEIQSVSNGDDDVKQQDDKDSDNGELSSPTSQNHNSHQNHSSEGDEEENEKGEKNSHTPVKEALKIKDSEEPSTVVEGDAVVPVNREFEIEDKSSKVDRSSSESSIGSNSSKSSGSNSDDESNCIKKGETAIDIAPVTDLGNGNEPLSGVPAENIVSAEIDDAVDSVVENFSAEELKNTSTLGDIVERDTSFAPSTIPMESKEEKLGFVEGNGISTVFMDVPMKRKDESIKNIVIPDPKECVAAVEVEKDSEVTECKQQHGRVVVDSLRCLQGLRDNSSSQSSEASNNPQMNLLRKECAYVKTGTDFLD